MEERWCRCTVARRGRGGGHKRRNCIGPARWLDFNRSATYKVAENQIIPARPVPHPPPLATSFSLPPSFPPSPPLLDLYFPVGHDCEPFFFSFPFFFFSPSPPPIPGFLSRGFLLIPANQTFAIRHYDEDEPTRSLASNWRRGRNLCLCLSPIELRP